MSRRSALATRLVAAVALAVGVLAVTASPTVADDVTTISAINTSVTGRASGSVQTTAPYVRVSLLSLDDGLRMVEHGVPVAVTEGSVPFDFVTWGVSIGRIRVTSCSSGTSCDGPTVESSFETSDVAPGVTWGADTTVGPGQTYPIQVSDPSGGGTLQSWWAGYQQPVGRNGVTRLLLPGDIKLDVVIYRCHPVNPNICTVAATSPEPVEVNRVLEFTATAIRALLSPGDTTYPIELSVMEGDDFALQWVVTQGADPLPGFGGTIRHLDRDAKNKIHVSLDLTGIPSGPFLVSFQLAADIPGFGVVKGTTSRGGTYDDVAPTVDHIDQNLTTFYPVQDGYRDVLTVYIETGTDAEEARLELVNDSGKVVRTISGDLEGGFKQTSWLQWHGRDDEGALVPEGEYTARIVLVDTVGNEGSLEQPVTVSLKQEILHVATETVTAAESLIDAKVGRCSTLRKPSKRGWTGSLGLYSNTKCEGTDGAAEVTTVHQLDTAVVPWGSVHRLESVRIEGYGGAATSQPQSYLWISYLRDNGNWQLAKYLKRTLGWHTGVLEKDHVTAAVNPTLTWRAKANWNQRYDLKSFRLTLSYYVLDYPAP